MKPLGTLQHSLHVRLTIGVVTIALALVLGVGRPAWAKSAEEKFDAAQSRAAKLRENPAQQKYRDRWLNCIDNFLAIEKAEPRGAWTAASLYNAGLLYSELHRHSWLDADKQAAIDLMDRVLRDFPDSRYAPKAQLLREKLGAGKPRAPAARAAERPAAEPKAEKEIPADKPAQAHPDARKWHDRAQYRFDQLISAPEKQKIRDHWLACVSSYRQAYQAEPKGPLAPSALYGIASSYKGLHKWSRMAADRKEAEKAIAELIEKFPDSPQAIQAKDSLTHEIPPDEIEETTDNIAQLIDTSNTPAAADKTANGTASAAKPAVVDGLRYWSNPRYTRVVINADVNTTYTYRELREDPATGKPQRIYVDLQNSRLGKDAQKVVPINDDLLTDARAGQYSDDTVRVVVDIKSFKTFKIFSLRNPFRIVLDVWGVDEKKTPPVEIAKKEPEKQPQLQQRPKPTFETEVPRQGKAAKIPPSAIVKQLALGVRRIVIDPGHGGKDFGAPGYTKGVHEKYVVMEIAERLARKIRSELGCEVLLTRKSDKYISLEERTAIANTQNADLFISIHTNASPDSRAYGIETFILNLATDDESIRVAARENATSMKNISDLDSILKDLMQNAKVSESTRLASYVQQSMVRKLGAKYKNIRSKGVKQAPFYVLLGADMPSILVETSFISNPEECRRLTNSDYQDHLCAGILDGVKRYIQETNPMASWRPSGPRKGTNGG